ncbi:MAG: ATP-binding cassette domain-containing protein [Myxococcales bacterium]|nr:ATP-binding cassette domain-containing protein [Myxococcales bacterium]
MGILEIRNLTMAFNGKKILNNLSIDFWENHVHALIGPNGAGKSTLAGTIMGLPGYENYTGDIYFAGDSIKSLPVDERARRLRMTLAWQEPARFEGLSVHKFIAAGARDKSTRHVGEMLDLVGLDPSSYLARAVDKTLSGGERKRIELASILAMEPKLVLMDEPDSGIDVEALERIFAAIKILKSGGATIILITHSMAVLQQAEHAFLMCCGQLIDQGAVDKIQLRFNNHCRPCDHPNLPLAGE